MLGNEAESASRSAIGVIYGEPRPEFIVTLRSNPYGSNSLFHQFIPDMAAVPADASPTVPTYGDKVITVDKSCWKHSDGIWTPETYGLRRDFVLTDFSEVSIL